MLFLYAVIIFVILIYLVYSYFTRNFKYWQSRNIPGPRPLPFFGNFKDFVLRKSNVAEIHKQIYNDYPSEKVVGIYRMTRRSLLIRDLDVIKNVLIKDFEFFEDRGIAFSIKSLGANLFHSDAEIWRPLRNQLSPLFTTNKLRNMIPLMNDKCDMFVDHVNKVTEIQSDQDIYTLFKKFTVSSITACAFGLDINADSPIFERLIKIDDLIFTRRIPQELDLLQPGVLRKLNISLFHKEVTDFFLQLVNDVIIARNGALSTRNDFIDLILELRNQGNKAKTRQTRPKEYIELTNNIIAAQAFSFYSGGYETNASTMSFMMYELTKNPSIQEKLIAEVDEALNQHNGTLTYEIISDLPYMDQVFNETLRKYPITEVVRRANADYNIPGTNIIIEKGITIIVPLLAISHDEKYYPNPNQFDPERFFPENKSKRHPCAFIPFGDGPRHCIGKLFAKIQSRICLLKFLSNFRVEASKSSPATVLFNPNRISNSPKGGIYLNILRRHKSK